jgi:translation initiation factor 1
VDNSRLVYSTDSDRVCPDCGQPIIKCSCKRKKSKQQRNVEFDGIIRIRRELKGRKGKTVTTVSGFQINADELKNLATQLKRRCGAGGSMKDGVIIIQCDHRDTLITELKHRRFKAKIAGGYKQKPHEKGN